jgi:hypothetical protein
MWVVFWQPLKNGVGWQTHGSIEPLVVGIASGYGDVVWDFLYGGREIIVVSAFLLLRSVDGG